MRVSFLVGIASAVLFSAAVSAAEPENNGFNDTARFLAGMPPAPGSAWASLSGDHAWQGHAHLFDEAWAGLERRQLSKIHTWASEHLGEAYSKPSLIYYMFSGPDYLYVDAFFPNGSTYILCGTEPIGSLPDPVRLERGAVDGELHRLQESLNSVLSFSFFITKQMKKDVASIGTLPILFTFLARSHKTIRDMSFVSLDKDGAEQPAKNDNPGSGLVPGVKITFTQENGPLQTLYYFTTNISDDGIEQNPGFLSFCAQLGSGNSFVKCASYLMHRDDFSVIRSFLLGNSQTLVQDDSGIPLRFFTEKEWQLRLFGTFQGPIQVFKEWPEPDLAELYRMSHPIPLDFGIGYRHHAGESMLMVATKK